MLYKYKTIEQPDDYESKVITTIISCDAFTVSDRCVIYIHGYIDYFFQDDMAEMFASKGYNFYAVDLRKYGRSYIKGQHFNYCRDMSEYYPDVTACIDTAKSDGNQEIILIGHSTGGLLASLYAIYGQRREFIDAVILNSPFLEFNASWFKRKIAIPLAGLLSLVFPYVSKRNELSELYPESIHSRYRGEWEYDESLKPKNGVPLYFAWLWAVHKGQRMVKRRLNIEIPVLVLSSGCSCFSKEWSEKYTYCDTVLNVEHIQKYGKMLGSRVELVTVNGGLHDIFLSRKDIRDNVYDTVFEWINSVKS